MTPRRVLLLSESSETGGAENVFASLVERIDRARFTPVAALLREGWLADRLRHSGATPRLVPTAPGALDVRLLRGIRRLVRDEHIDVVHAHLFTTSLYASVACALGGPPVIATFHGTMDVGSDDRAKRLKWAVLERLADRVVYVSQYLQAHFESQGLGRRARALVVYNGIDLARFHRSPERAASDRAAARAALQLPEDAFVVGCVGDLRPAKDYATALRAIASLRERLPAIRLVVAGTLTPMLDDLRRLRSELGLDPVVEFVGFQPAIERFLPALDVYLSTSTSEGFSLTVIEAMAAGIPVVSTRSGGPQEILRPGETGVLVPVGDPTAVGEAVLGIARDPAAARRLRHAAAEDVARRFSLDRMVASYEAMYDDVAAGA
jgi:glycosyltransferase involved in cell wall biosynthesis